MKQSIIMFMILAAAFMILTTTPARATVIAAKSCSQADVQDAINAAQDGDTVQVPAGTATWTFCNNNQSPDLTFEPNLMPSILLWKKAITLQGAGIGQTVITDGTAALTSAAREVTRFMGTPSPLTVLR